MIVYTKQRGGSSSCERKEGPKNGYGKWCWIQPIEATFLNRGVYDYVYKTHWSVLKERYKI